MAYLNYINGDGNTVSGNNTHSYSNYANAYYAAGYSPAYGYYGCSYANYNNWFRREPAAYTITAGTSHFSDWQIMYSTNMIADITKLRADLVKLSQEKIAADKNPIYTTPAFTENIDAKFNLGTSVGKAQIQEMTTLVQQLWQAIRGEPGSGWPNLTDAHPYTLDTDYKSLINKTQDLANTAQNRNYGYLNCANWSNYAGDSSSGPYPSGGLKTAGADSYTGGNR